MSTSIISFGNRCHALPRHAVEFSLRKTPFGHALSVSAPKFAKLVRRLGLPSAAAMAVEVFHPLMPGNHPSLPLGPVGCCSGDLDHQVVLRDLPSAEGVEIRFVVKDPNEPRYIARTERFKPADDESASEKDGPKPNGFIYPKASRSSLLPVAYEATPLYPTILVNPDYMSLSQFMNSPEVAIHLTSAIQVFVTALIIDTDGGEAKYPKNDLTSPAWIAFKQRCAALLGAESWESFLETNDRSVSETAIAVTELFFRDGGIRDKYWLGRSAATEDSDVKE